MSIFSFIPNFLKQFRVISQLPQPTSYLEKLAADGGPISYEETHRRRFTESWRFAPRIKGGVVLELGSVHPPPPEVVEQKEYGLFQRADWTGANDTQIADAIDYNFNLEESWPVPSNHFDLVLAWEIIEHLAWDPMNLLFEANRVLKLGGVLFITTPNICSYRGMWNMLHGHWPYRYAKFHKGKTNPAHCREYDVHVLSQMLRDAGFEPSVTTVTLWDDEVVGLQGKLAALGYSATHRGDNIFAFGKKTSEPLIRYPEYLFD